MPTLKEIIDIVKFVHVDIVGSKADTDLRYFSDIDLHEFVKTDETYNKILEYFQYKFKEVRETPNLYITDFKAGFYSGKPIKWTYEDIMNGYKYFDNDLKITFREVLTQESTIKLDLVAFLNDEYIEITTNYFFDFKGKNKSFHELTDDEIKKELLYSSRLLRVDNNVYKSLKRLYSYYSLTKNKKGQERLIKLFNSPIGYLNKLVNSLKTISLLINNEKKPVKSDIVKAIYKIRNHLKPYSNAIFLNNLDNMPFDKIDSRVNKTIDKLKEIVSKETDKYILSLK